MNRRTALTHVAALVGGFFSAPTLYAMRRWEEEDPHTGPPMELTETQKMIAAEVAEMIIPRTNTPGAKDVGVPAFLIMMLQDCYKTPEQESFKAGLSKLEEKQFLNLDQNQRAALLQQVEKDTVDEMKAYQVQRVSAIEATGSNQTKQEVKGLPFWRLIKELTMLGYFTSEEGIKASFEYVPVPGRLEMIKMTPNQKSFAY